jgi:Putative auto-transporter adhesin, head GIN domain
MKKIFLLFIALLSFAFGFAQTKETRSVDTFNKISFRTSGKLYLRQGSPQKIELEGSKELLDEMETKVEGGKLIIGKKEKWNWSWGDDKITAYVTVKDINAISVSGSGDVVGETKIITSDIDLKVSGSGNLQIEVEASGEMEADVSGSGKIDLKGTCQSFDSDISGSGRVVMNASIKERATFGISGSGKIEATGVAKDVKAVITGSGKLATADLEVEKCEVRITGSGDVKINVKSELDANITGSGSVMYKGNPNHVNSHASGSGHVKKM